MKNNNVNVNIVSLDNVESNKYGCPVWWVIFNKDLTAKQLKKINNTSISIKHHKTFKNIYVVESYLNESQLSNKLISLLNK